MNDTLATRANKDDPEEDKRHKQLLLEVWRRRVDSDGEILPSLDKLEYWHRTMRHGKNDAGRIRKRALTGKACRRLKRDFDLPFHPKRDLGEVAAPIAEFVIELRRLRSFPSLEPKMETLVVHSCCKFAGYPPIEIYDAGGEWEQAVGRANPRIARSERSASLTELLAKRLAAAIAKHEEAEEELPQKIGYRSRKVRRRAISDYVYRLLARKQ
ncbi:MAG: hypothetical protein WA687_11570 [Solirubrobacterales bacterium]